jgi:choline kinase
VARLRAAILAAGRGVRMGGEIPKTLLPLGGDEPLLHHILQGVRSAGITDVLIVTGFKAGAVQEFVAEHAEGLEVTFVRNTRYASWGNFHSLRMAVDQSPGMDLLVVNCDVVMVPSVYRRVLEAEGDLALAVERRRRLDEEDMRVELADHRVVAIGKHLKMARSHGEFAGVSMLRPAAAQLYADTATDWEWRVTTDGYYEDVYATLLERLDTRAVFVEAGEYAEVDTPEDVAAARAVIRDHADSWAAPATAE